MLKLLVLTIFTLSLFGCAKHEPKCSDSRDEIVEKFNSLIDKNNSLIGLISQTNWYHNPTIKIANLNRTNITLNESEKTLSSSTAEKLNTNCDPNINLTSLKSNLNNMLTYVQSEITTIKEINKNKDLIVKNSSCLNEDDCNQVLLKVYNIEIQKYATEFKLKISENK